MTTSIVNRVARAILAAGSIFCLAPRADADELAPAALVTTSAATPSAVRFWNALFPDAPPRPSFVHSGGVPRARHESAWFFDLNAAAGVSTDRASAFGRTVGVEASLGARAHPARLTLALFDDLKTGARDALGWTPRTRSFEAAAGVQLSSGEAIRPEIGGGALLFTSRRTWSHGPMFDNSSSRGLGGWLSAGASMRVAKNVNAGGRVRYSTADARFSRGRADIGGLDFALVAGIGFGSPTSPGFCAAP